MARSSGRAFFTNFGTYDAPFIGPPRNESSSLKIDLVGNRDRVQRVDRWSHGALGGREAA
jgi:hypothetical protein